MIMRRNKPRNSKYTVFNNAFVDSYYELFGSLGCATCTVVVHFNYLEILLIVLTYFCYIA